MSTRYTHSLPRSNYSTPEAYSLPRTLRLFPLPRKNYAAIVINGQKPSVDAAHRYPTVNQSAAPEPVRMLALLLPGHNEELIIQSTINSAIASGMEARDIYVVDDNSSDATRAKAVELLGHSNVLTVERSGKARAVLAAINHFEIQNRYQWLHVADADSVFGKDYFRIYREALKDKKYVIGVGFVQSLRGNWLATYRALSYTYSQHVNRRWQSWFGMISVFPGPITSFRTDILSKLDFTVDSIADDFDLTVQVHRKKLGKIRYIPGAVNYTQDPQTLKDFCKQTARWQRGFFQGVAKYRIGTKMQPLDLSIGFSMLQMIFYLLEMGVFLPLSIYLTGRWIILPLVMLADFFVVSLMAIFSAIMTKRISILGALPYYYFLRWLEVGIFVMAFVEIFILRKFRSHTAVWDTENRRYALDTNALKDSA